MLLYRFFSIFHIVDNTTYTVVAFNVLLNFAFPMTYMQEIDTPTWEIGTPKCVASLNKVVIIIIIIN